MSKQILIDYLNEDLTKYDTLIFEQQDFQRNLNQSIASQEQAIISYKEQIVQSDLDIAIFNTDKEYVHELIAIVEASIFNKN